ncbi:LAQU0S01e03862g1_1 [Lachancea quebecensis]|uniref:LAQU0S01e03862g1_1 n=1 Tax=Lachancea quebecensis TaxID=1654605 RepID=A0A0P1KL10_9SACH|nr:LAQU0S01e03862g1_1 [Lachancea quebecensis]
MKPSIFECFCLLVYANTKFCSCSNYETLNGAVAKDSEKPSLSFRLALEPEFLSKCLVAPFIKGDKQFVHVPGMLANQASLDPSVPACLLDIEQKSSLGLYGSEEEVVFEYYACIISRELRVLADRREQRQLKKNPPEGNWLAKHLPALVDTAKCLIIIVTLIAFQRYFELSFLKIIEELRNQSHTLMSALDFEVSAVASNVLNLEASMGIKLQKLKKKVKGDIRSSGKAKAVSVQSRKSECSMETFPAIEKDSKGRETDLLDKISLCSNETASRINSPLQKTMRLPLELVSKKKGLLFDLTTKKGRNDWKEYINRDIRQIPAHRRNTAEELAIVNSSETRRNNSSEEKYALDESLQNVPLYDKHGKPLRRICVPGIGWISRKKYLEQRG